MGEMKIMVIGWIFWIIGSILIVLSVYIVGFSIPSCDTTIESIDLKISKLNDKISEIENVIADTKTKEVEVKDTINTMKILKNLPQTESVKSSYESLKEEKIGYFAHVIYPMMIVNGEKLEYFTTTGEYGNYSRDISSFKEHIRRMGQDKANELLLEQYGKAIDRLNTLTKDKLQLQNKKGELIIEKKDKLKCSSCFQVLGLIFIFIGTLIFKVS